MHPKRCDSCSDGDSSGVEDAIAIAVAAATLDMIQESRVASPPPLEAGCSQNLLRCPDNQKKPKKPQQQQSRDFDDLEKATPVKQKKSAGGDVEEVHGKGEEKGSHRFLGILLTLLAAFQFSMSALIIKILGYHPFNLGVWRFGVMSLIPIPFLLYSAFAKKEDIFQEFRTKQGCKTALLVMVQAITGANSILLVFYGLKYLNIGDMIVIGTSAPVFVTLFAFLCLGEKCGVVPLITALLALLGVGIISKPPILTGKEGLEENTMLGVASSFGSMLLLTVCYVVIRFLRRVHHALVNLVFALWGLLQSLVLAYLLDVLRVPYTWNEVVLIILSALLAFFAQTCLTLALKHEQAGPVALVRTTEVLFAFLWQTLFLGVQPDLFSILGAIVTLSGVVLTAARKTVMGLPEEDKFRRRLRFLLF